MGVHKTQFVPFEPSSLRILSGPHSPASPLTPTRTQLHFPILPSPRSMTFGAGISSIKITVSAPPETMPWVWSCHKCHTRYALGATRRCLHDGHYFCGGTTVDKNTGKTRKHRACASEFDYIGWEDFGAWKRAQRLVQKPSFKHCEDQCDFPSACHWKARHTPKKTANFDFLDPNCLSSETKTNPKPNTPVVKKTGLYIDRFFKSAEKRASQLTTLLSTMDEESNFASTPGYIAPPTPTPPRLPELNSLHLTFPALAFSSPEKDSADHQDTPSIPSPPFIPPQSPPPTPSAILEAVANDNHPAPTSPPQQIPFDFHIASPPTPLSPPHTPWSWTPNEIGLALSPPPVRACDEIWDEQMETAELDDEMAPAALWQKGEEKGKGNGNGNGNGNGAMRVGGG